MTQQPDPKLRLQRVFKTSKINEFRLWGLFLTMGGMGMMILGT